MFDFHKRQGISWNDEELSGPEENLCSMNLVNSQCYIYNLVLYLVKVCKCGHILKPRLGYLL
jgi:hypothetical protein